ncbi:MAG TPA: single-stranded DNA-binding protein [Armatimonadota bacterium]|nr:single-stranded DNA-binding protein [Armatimonadota bacterium]
MVNKVFLVGRLCTDPELKYTPSGVAVANFRVAVDRPFANAQGERETDFIDVVAWRQSAEFVNTYLAKGRLVLVEGRLQVRQWQTQDGQRRRSTEVVADHVRALDRPREQGEQAGAAAPRSGASRPTAVASEPDMIPDFDVPDITDPFADQ